MSFAEVNLDSSDEHPDQVEDIRVWSISTSGKTGRVSATRKNHRHVREHQLEPRNEEPPTVEEVGTPADPEPTESTPAKVAAKHKRVRIRIVKENDSVSLYQWTNGLIDLKLIITRYQTRMTDWLAYCWFILDELLRREGLEDSPTPGLCVNCEKSVAAYRCSDCLGGNLSCLACTVSCHRHLPLHRIQVCPMLLVPRSC